MKVTLLLLFLSLTTWSVTLAQDSASPYELSWKKDALWLSGSLGATAVGTLLKSTKDGITEADLGQLSKDNIIFFDRWAAGNYSENLNNLSDIPFYASFLLPFGLLADGQINDHSGQLAILYLESLSTTAGLFTLTAGIINRSRPLVYSVDAPLNERLEGNAQNSFYSGHVAATASATFFAAKVFSDFYPDSPLRPYFWTAAAVIPATVGYLRIRAGKHFLSDVILGYALGAASGILIPELHKTQSSVVISSAQGLTPIGQPINGLALIIDL